MIAAGARVLRGSHGTRATGRCSRPPAWRSRVRRIWACCCCRWSGSSSGRWRELVLPRLDPVERGGAAPARGTGPDRAEPADPAADDAAALRGHVATRGRRPGSAARRWSSATAPRRSILGREYRLQRASSSWSCCGRPGCACGRRATASASTTSSSASATSSHAARRVSLTDPLTDALNRRGFEERLRRELADSARSGRAADARGPRPRRLQGGQRSPAATAAGDALLRETVERLSGVLRPLDVARAAGRRRVRGAVPRRGRADRREPSSAGCATRSPAACRIVRLQLLPGRRRSVPRSCSSGPTSHLYAAKAERPRQERTGDSSWSGPPRWPPQCSPPSRNRHAPTSAV